MAQFIHQSTKNPHFHLGHLVKQLKQNFTEGQETIIQHESSDWSMKIFDLFIQCPISYDVRTENESKYVMHEYEGIQRSFAVDKVSTE